MLRRLTLIALLCLLGAPTAAEAAPDPGRDPLVQRWLGVARAYWGASPPCLGGVDAVAGNWGPGGDAWAYASAGSCWIALRPTAYPAPPRMDLTWWRAAMCTTTAHEWGHLLGYGHSPDPSSLMYPYVPVGAVPGCAPGAEAPAGPAPRKRAQRCAAKARAQKRRCVRRSGRSRRAPARAHRRRRP
jgi:Matrixin